MRKPTRTGWQKDGSYIPSIPNAQVSFTATKQYHGKYLLLRGKAGWGDFFDSLEEVEEYLRRFKKENTPVYWSQGYQAHTSPLDHLFSTVDDPEKDWVQVELEVYLNKKEIH